ncbi:MAG TPA: alpha/beta-type small acid-soluble spore protein [Halanaerobiaceae bacterium]|jgi:hypothetical protein|nr:alpha/beta-type small acid-soluble spore protein [Bacillota bacterium]HHU91758.1 alpha/beta-type small acid-soluble spore protein [Halanaerobiaceae bacterium]HOA40382.1 alpha/beta-type small acid-soluble spore protein [Halanaerobiales bacterium]HPZ63671.1 alpha/beta-type small acid-soluble spore protein [Halanaerobiales bacterium]HQD04936.1 alpha/beta-type small acid-soluble spore protein [Halanaerobiales bacterium]
MGTGQKRNTLINPLAAQAMEKFKYEVANELGISIPQDGYWGNYTTRDTGSIGGHMVRKMVEAYENSLAGQAQKPQGPNQLF